MRVLKTISEITNMLGFSPWDKEEVFCNAVAGETLVPRDALMTAIRRYTGFAIDDVDSIANKFSVSSEVIARRLYDVGICTKDWYDRISGELIHRFHTERESLRAAAKMGLSDGPRRNMPREAIDRTSTAMCDILLRGLSEGFF